jgi:Tol biopolymer transport system component
VFTPDGLEVVFQVAADGRTDGDIVAVGIDGNGRRAVVDGPTNDLAGMVSPDGERIAFLRSSGPTVEVSPDQDPTEVWVAPLTEPAKCRACDPPLQVATDLCRCQPAWSPDSTRIVTWTPDWGELVIVTIDGSTPPVRVPSPGNVGVASWQTIGG